MPIFWLLSTIHFAMNIHQYSEAKYCHQFIWEGLHNVLQTWQSSRCLFIHELTSVWQVTQVCELATKNNAIQWIAIYDTKGNYDVSWLCNAYTSYQNSTKPHLPIFCLFKHNLFAMTKGSYYIAFDCMILHNTTLLQFQS